MDTRIEEMNKAFEARWVGGEPTEEQKKNLVVVDWFKDLFGNRKFRESSKLSKRYKARLPRKLKKSLKK
jgi:hypothetical protein